MKVFTTISLSLVLALQVLQSVSASIIATPDLSLPTDGFTDDDFVDPSDPFGTFSLSAMGQTVTADDDILSSFSFIAASLTPATFYGYVAEFSGGVPTSLVYQSPVSFTPNTNYGVVTFTPNVAVTSGNQYLLFVSPFSLLAPTATISDIASLQLGGVFTSDPFPTEGVYVSTSTNYASLLNNWLPAFGNADLAFSANFTGSGPSGVPEPSSMALMGIGMGIVGLIRCRRSKKAAVDSQAV